MTYGYGVMGPWGAPRGGGGRRPPPLAEAACVSLRARGVGHGGWRGSRAERTSGFLSRIVTFQILEGHARPGADPAGPGQWSHRGNDVSRRRMVYWCTAKRRRLSLARFWEERGTKAGTHCAAWPEHRPACKHNSAYHEGLRACDCEPFSLVIDL